MKTFVAALAALSTMAAAGAAGATIYNIDATSSTGVTTPLVAGHKYLVQYVGKAEGGDYDAANFSCASGSCATGWTNALLQFDPSDPPSDFDIEIDVVKGAALLPAFSFMNFSSAADSLAAYKQGVWTFNIEVVGGVGKPITFDGFTSLPAIFTPESDSARWVVFDPDGNRENNFGGVSLSISEVPEPANWALMVLGLGALGAVTRRRNAAAARA
jgi:hypothetical protein